MSFRQVQSLLGELIDLAPDRATELIGQLQQANSSESRLDKRAISAFFGVSIKTIESWQMRGMPYHETGEGKPVYFDASECARWLAAHKSVTSNRSPEEAKADLRYREEKARLASLQRQKLERELVDLKMVQEVHCTVTADIRRRVEQFHRRFGDEAQEMLNAIIDEAHEEFAKRFDELRDGFRGDDPEVVVASSVA